MKASASLPTKEEVLSADAKGLKAICARLGIKPKGKIDAIREAVLDELEARAKPKEPVNREELDALSDEEVAAVLESLGFKSRGKKSKLREALAKHLGIDEPDEEEDDSGPKADKGKAGKEKDPPVEIPVPPTKKEPAGKGPDSSAAAFMKALSEGAGVQAQPAAAKPSEESAAAQTLAAIARGAAQVAPPQKASPAEGKPTPPVGKAAAPEKAPVNAPPKVTPATAKITLRREPSGEAPETARSFSQELHLGILLYGMGKNQEAIERLKKAMEMAKSQHEESLCSLYLGNAHYALGQRFEATPYYDDVEDIAGLKALATENRAMAAAEDGDLQQAVQIFEEIIAKDPSLQRVWFRRGEVLLRMGKPGAALQSFDKMDRGADGAGYLLKGAAFLRMGQAQKSKEHFNEALRVSSTNRRAWLSKATLAVSEGDVREAELAVENALKLDKNDKTAWVCKAAVLHLQGRHAEALEALSTADPKMRAPELRSARAFLLLRLDRLDEAKRLVDQPLSGTDAEAHDILGVLLAREGDETGARARFERALELAPDFADPAANLKHLEDKKPAASKQARQKALQAELEREIKPAATQSGGGDCPRCEAKGAFIAGRCALCGYGGSAASSAKPAASERKKETDAPGRCPFCGFFVGEGAEFCPACEADLSDSTLSSGEKGVLDFLLKIEGMDAEAAGEVVRHNYRTLSALSKATLQELVSIPGISVTLAKRIMEALK